MGRIFFKINFRNQIVTVSVSQENTTFSVDEINADIVLNNVIPTVNPAVSQKHKISHNKYLNF
jgi:hypothetical protein